MFGVPTGLAELVAFIAQPIHLPIGLVAGALGFFVWRSLRHSA